jgi:hypothetical protein
LQNLLAIQGLLMSLESPKYNSETPYKVAISRAKLGTFNLQNAGEALQQ